MPIRKDLLPLYPKDWRAISHRVRFEREGGVCQGCGRLHGGMVRRLPDGRYLDGLTTYWRNAQGEPADWPTLEQLDTATITRVWLACCHLDNNPRNNADENLAALCQRCHLMQDKPYHTQQRKITHRRKLAMGDLFDPSNRQS